MALDSRPSFKTLSEAIRHGIPLQTVPDPPDPAIGGRQGRGALQAAWRARHPETSASYVSTRLAEDFPELHKPAGNSCPAGPNTSCPEWPKQNPRTLEVAIIHLEDTHAFSREQVASWLEAYGF